MMKYLKTETERKHLGGTCYFEFQKGQNEYTTNYEFWKNDSLLLHMNLMDEIKLYKIIPNFNYYGITYVSKQTWADIKKTALDSKGKVLELIEELSNWVDSNFEKYDYFLIMGI